GVALIVAGFITLAVLGVDVFGLVAGLGVGGLVVGFALKEIIENLISGVLILIQRPFQPGDVIEVDGSTGTVQRVELRATVIRTFDNVEVNIPNRIVYTSVVKNFSIYPTRRFEVTVRMQRTQDLAAVRQRLIAAVRKVVGVAETPAPSVLFEDLNWAIARGKVYYHVQINQRPIEDVRNEVLVAVSTVLDSQ
ncbi:MAG: mechanosensitive ion channel, partial [Anaerolineae bacterium]|nr:mechanosensitive ion channel [Anaerolineae bacterium]